MRDRPRNFRLAQDHPLPVPEIAPLTSHLVTAAIDQYLAHGNKLSSFPRHGHHNQQRPKTALS